MRAKLVYLISCFLVLALAGSASADLMGYWNLDEGAGDVVHDRSGNGNHGTIHGATWTEGYYEGALQFNGQDNYVEIPNSESLETDTDVTVSAWINWTDAGDGWLCILANGQQNGPWENYGLFVNRAGRYLYFTLSLDGGHVTQSTPNNVITPDTWFHAAATWDGSTARVYVDGELVLEQAQTGTLVPPGVDLRIGHRIGSTHYYNGIVDDVAVLNQALTEPEIQEAMLGFAPAELAADPSPANDVTDVPRDVPLTWTPGEFAATHDIYLGTSFADVNAADRANPLGILVSEGQAAATYQPPTVLEFGQTYCWRIDEVNAAPDNTIFRGEIWSFTVEPFAYPVANVLATSNGASEADAGPERTVDGSGLNADDQHSTASSDMWLAVPGAEPLQIQYDLDRVYKLHEMLVWNYNVQFELILGFGIKDVTVEYSGNGTDWTVLGDAVIAQATARDSYAANTAIQFGGLPVKAVRLTVNSGYGLMGQFGLSEVRFMFIPVQARQPQPPDAETDVTVTPVLSWRPGREAVSHEVSFGVDPDALSPVATVDVPTFDPGTLDLAATYYWQIDEVNAAEEISVWEGDVWTFTTQAFIVVDDFESYNDGDNRIFDTWADGFVNETGATVGYFEAPFAERSIVNSGTQSMPLFFDNAGVATSEADLSLSQDWTASGIQSLTLYFYGAADNSGGQLYVKINDTKVVYDGPAISLNRPTWQRWNIDLSTAGNVSNVSSLTIGVEGAGASGVVYIDDIRLYPEVFGAVAADVTTPGDTLQGVPNDGDWPDAETPDLAIDDSASTKYLHRKGGSMATGFQVEPMVGATVVTGLTLTTANDVPTRDPIAFELSGSNAGLDGPYELIAAGDIVDFAGEADWPRLTRNETPIEFENTKAYTYYQLIFPALRGQSETLMQIAEVELIGSLAP